MTASSNVKQNVSAFVLSLLIFCLSFGSTSALAQQRRTRGRNEAAPVVAQSSVRANPAQTQRARLVLLIVVDQFRYDYLERYGDLFVNNGLRRLMREGASWTQANFDHTPTYTAPGHATLMTGAWPSETGIVGNDWFERSEGKRVSSVTDDTTLLLGGIKADSNGASPRRLLASTLGDELRLATNDRSKVVGISLKSRAAILPSGRHANAAYWLNIDNGNMVSSTYYFDRLPQWVESFNAMHMADNFFGKRWERLLPEGEYLKRVGVDAPPWEDIEKAKDTNTFPHVITGGADKPSKDFYEALDYTPFTNDILLAFTEQAIANEKLGADDDTDLLSISFSSNDYIGHRFGSYSQESMDATLRVDRTIGALLDYVDAHVGLQNTEVVFTADHGVALIPEHAVALNLPGRRVMTTSVLNTIRAALKERFNRKKDGDTTADYIQTFKDKIGFINGNIYLNMAALKRDGIDFNEAERAVGEAALTIPGTARYFTRTQLEAGAISPSDDVARRVLHGFQSQRSGDVILVYQPYNILFGEPENPTDARATTTHGSPYTYDTHVPLILMGRGFAAGRYEQAAAPSDIAPTLAAILRVQAPSSSMGRLLLEGFTNSTKAQTTTVQPR